MRLVLAVCIFGLLELLSGCERPERTSSAPTLTTTSSPQRALDPDSAATSTAGGAAPTATAVAPEPERRDVVLIAGGDVSYGRQRGKLLLANPARDDLSPLTPLFASADLRFVNLECPISDQNGETQSPINQLVFTAPPAAAPALARANVDIVSLANNHAWDYGREALLETLDHLDEAGVRYVGAGRTRGEAYAPRIVERNGLRIAFVAGTAVWNQPFDPHPGKELVADVSGLVAAVEQAERDADWVVASFHGGEEYIDQPLPGAQALMRELVDAGADVIIGHHPHVIQRPAIYAGRPIFFSIGNLLMRQVTDKPWTGFGALAKVTLPADGGPIRAALCPFRIHGFDPVPLTADAKRPQVKALLRHELQRLVRQGAITEPDSAVALEPFDADGCAAITPAPR